MVKCFNQYLTQNKNKETILNRKEKNGMNKI